ncbi:MAG: hypothetical protein ABEJ58_00225 [Halodesulfurarchaeum sp.]
MTRKTKQTIADGVETAIRQQFDLDSDADIEVAYEHNQGDYERVRARLPSVPIESGTRYEQPVEEWTILFEVLESDPDDSYLLRVRID